LFNLDHYFWTRNPSRSSKVLKDSDCSLVSNKNFCEILPSNGLGSGPREVGQGGVKVLYLWRHSQKISTPNQKCFFIANYKTCQVFWEFEQLSSAFGSGVMLASSHICDLAVLAWKSL